MIRLERAAYLRSMQLEDEVAGLPKPPVRLAAVRPHWRPQRGERWVVARGPRHTPVGALAHLLTPRSENHWAGAEREPRSAGRRRSRLRSRPPGRGHRDFMTWLVTAPAAPGCDQRPGPERAQPGSGPRDQRVGSGAKQLKAAKGLRKTGQQQEVAATM